MNLEMSSKALREIALGGDDVTELRCGADFNFAICVQQSAAFFRILPDANAIFAEWEHLQLELVRLREDLRITDRLLDLYLVLVSLDSLEKDDRRLQSIAGDPYVCRKLVVEWPEDRPAQLLAQLPFWPLDLGAETGRCAPGLANQIVAKGFSREWVDTLLSHESAETILGRLSGGQLSVDTQETLRPTPDTELSQPQLVARQAFRILSMSVTGFRSFGRDTPVDLDADLVAIYGRNGTGKTSLCEAIEWGIIGEVGRLANRDYVDRVEGGRNPLFHFRHQDARVVLRLESPSGTRELAREQTEGSPDRFFINGEIQTGARDGIMAALDAEFPAKAHVTSIRNAFRCYHFLDQDTFVDFLMSASPTERYVALQPLIGTTDLGQVVKKATRVRDKLLGQSSILESELATTDTNLAEHSTRRAALLEDAEEQARKLLGEDPTALVHQTLRVAVELGLIEKQEDPFDGILATLLPILSSAVPGELRRSALKFEALGGLEAALKGLPELKQNQRQLQTRLKTIRRDVTDLRRRREEHQHNLKDLLAQLEQKAATKAALDQRKQAIDRMVALRSEIRDLTANVDVCRRAVEQSIPRLTNAERDAAALAAQLEKLEERRRSLDSAIAEHQGLLATMQSVARAAEEGGRLNAELEARTKALSGNLSTRADLKQQHEAALARAASLDTTVENTGYRIQDLQADVDEKQQLLAALAKHVSGSRCPLCGVDWRTRDALETSVARLLADVPKVLREAQGELARMLSVQRDAAAKERDLDARLADCDASIVAEQEHLARLQERLSTAIVTVGRSFPEELPLRQAQEKARSLADAESTAIGKLQSELETLNVERQRLDAVAKSASDSCARIRAQHLSETSALQEAQSKLASVQPPVPPEPTWMDVDEDARFEVAEQPPVPPEPTWMDVDEDARFEVAEQPPVPPEPTGMDVDEDARFEVAEQPLRVGRSLPWLQGEVCLLCFRLLSRRCHNIAPIPWLNSCPS